MEPGAQDALVAHSARIAREPGPAAPGLETSRTATYWMRICLRAAVILAATSIGWFLWTMREDVEAADFARIDVRKVRLATGATWSDPRWEAELARKLASLGAVQAEDEIAIDRLLGEVRGLSFVAEVGKAKVLWPDGLEVAVRLRVPVACVALGGQFAPIAADGVLLSGRWSAPPERDGGFLPVILCEGDSLDRLLPGQVLWPPSARDALCVATSMWTHLRHEDLVQLGRIVIDARDARRASPDVPGVVLLLERGRRVFFGRAPDTREPGELPVARKWSHLADALAYLEPRGGASDPLADWELVDVRWDRPEMLPRGGLGRSDAESASAR